MSRRGFIKGLIGIGLLPISARIPARENTRRLILQTSPIAGFQYYDGERLFPLLAKGDELELRREPDNCRDRKAVEVYWNGRKLGYLPRVENHAVSQMLDRGETLSARINNLGHGSSPWQRVEVQVGMLATS